MAISVKCLLSSWIIAPTTLDLWPSHFQNSAELALPTLTSKAFNGRELAFTFAICYRPSVCRLSVCRLSVTLVHPTQAVEIFRNFFHHTIAQGL